MSQEISMRGTSLIPDIERDLTKRSASTATAAETTSPINELSISKEAHSLERLYQAVLDSGEVDEEKVEAIRQKIARGEMDILKTGDELKTAAKELAGKIFNFENTLRGKSIS